MFKFNPLSCWHLSLEASQILAESQAVIGMRLAGMVGLWPVSAAETSQMVTEKLEAGAQAQRAALNTAFSGGSLTEIARAAMKPVGVRTKANVRRLTRKVGKSG